MKCEKCDNFKNGDCAIGMEEPCIDGLEKAANYFEEQIKSLRALICDRGDNEVLQKLSEKLNILGNAKIACEMILKLGKERKNADMLMCEGYKMFCGVMRVTLKGIGTTRFIGGTWLYKPETDCWYCNGTSYPSSACTLDQSPTEDKQ